MQQQNLPPMCTSSSFIVSPSCFHAFIASIHTSSDCWCNCREARCFPMRLAHRQDRVTGLVWLHTNPQTLFLWWSDPHAGCGGKPHKGRQLDNSWLWRLCQITESIQWWWGIGSSIHSWCFDWHYQCQWTTPYTKNLCIVVMKASHWASSSHGCRIVAFQS